MRYAMLLHRKALRRAPGGDGQENIRAVVQFYEDLLAVIGRLPEADRDIAGAEAQSETYAVRPLVVVLEIAAVVPAGIEAENAVGSGATWRLMLRFAEYSLYSPRTFPMEFDRL